MSLLIEPLDKFLRQAERLKLDIAPHHIESLFRVAEVFIVGEVLPCLSSPVRMRLLKKSFIDTSQTGTSEPIEMTVSAITQHLDFLRQTGLIGSQDRQSIQPTDLADTMYARLAPFGDSLGAFNERRTSFRRFDILSRLWLAWRDGVRSVSLSLLSKHCGLSESAMFKHLKQLQEAGLVEEAQREKWGSPYAISEKGRKFVEVLIESIQWVGMLTLQVATDSGTPRRIIFPTSTADNYHLLSFDGHKVTLETAEPGGLALQRGILQRLFARPSQVLSLEVLSPVRPQSAFYFYTDVGAPTGKAAASLEEFCNQLKTIDVASVKFHMRRGDFENWVKNVLGDMELAARLEKIRTLSLSGEQLRTKIYDEVKARYDALSEITAKK